MKFYRYITVAAVLCLLLCGCVPEDAHQNPPAPADTDAVVETTPAPPALICVLADGKTSYSVVRSIEISGAEQNLYSDFQMELSRRAGVRFKYTEAYDGQKVPESAGEILLGLTNRPESMALAQKLAAAGGNRFGILAGETRIAIAGSTVYQTYLGMNYFLNNFVTETDGGVTVSVEQGFEYISESSEDEHFTIEGLVDTNRGFSFAAAEKVAQVTPIGAHSNMQGGGTDGRHAYACMINQAASPETCMLHKFDLETGELIKVSELLPTNHSNDMTYDDKNHRLVICAGGAVGFVDPETLELVEQIPPPGGMYFRGIEYLPTTDSYVIASGMTFYLVDGSFNVISSFPCQDDKYVSQGLYCDEKLIYDVRYQNGGKVHAIVVHDMQGNYLGTGSLFGVGGEPENMFTVGDEYYLGSNRDNAFFRMVVMPEKWW